ncbi:GNAT family N-acetyltransferase [Cupriavidus agavae]|uniref:Putative N-acetyltransferase YhbS n=1 Tax=Cupriavidus agavae TaxID=1001822 RepID=A0A4Q7S918_9BURK|nr:GNAT family N-acetyltransferase [Cupriavidus agavae]RZT42278.1 putative N-acetyltransferase YhbS [Cupriavidus agavae]
MSEFQFRIPEECDIEPILGLMAAAFPGATLYSRDYLNWLYWKNPVGAAVGFNAWDTEGLTGHVVAIPQQIVLHGKPETAILLLNVATAPRARGKGLFIELVRRTIELAAERGHAAVLGVANAQTYRAYEQKLGFQNVAGLDAHVEFISHKLDMMWATERAQLHQDWTEETLQWRLSNPNNPLRIVAATRDSITVEGKSSMPIIRSRAIIPRRGIPVGKSLTGTSSRIGPAVVLGMAPKGTVRHRFALEVPKKMRPSPLRLVYRNLVTPGDRLHPEEILFSFLDFDAF